MLEVDPESMVTPWLVACWLKVVLQGLRRAHAVLRRFYDLNDIRTAHTSVAWEGVAGYFLKPEGFDALGEAIDDIVRPNLNQNSRPEAGESGSVQAG